MTRLFATSALCAAFLFSSACSSTGTGNTGRYTNEHLEGTIAALENRIDELTARNAMLERQNKETRARLEKSKSAEDLVASAKDEISEEARRVREQFEGDSDIDVEATEDGYRFVLHEKVLFDSGSADLTEKGRGALASVAEALQGGTDPIHIEGHTDDVPVAKPETLEKFPRGNIELSVMRALAVWEYLVKQGGIGETRLTVAGLGQHRPRVPNSSQQNRWRNRRVEIRIATSD